MPMYSFICESCTFEFTELLSVDKRKSPAKCHCPKCFKKTVIPQVSSICIFSDTTLTANKKTNGGWNQLMTKMKNGIPKKYHKTLDTASDRTGRRFKG